MFFGDPKIENMPFWSGLKLKALWIEIQTEAFPGKQRFKDMYWMQQYENLWYLFANIWLKWFAHFQNFPLFILTKSALRIILGLFYNFSIFPSQMEDFIRENFADLDLPPSKLPDTVFEYLVNENGEWEHWDARVRRKYFSFFSNKLIKFLVQ